VVDEVALFVALDGCTAPLPDPSVFEEAMREAGVRDDRPVVVYDDWAGRAAKLLPGLAADEVLDFTDGGVLVDAPNPGAVPG